MRRFVIAVLLLTACTGDQGSAVASHTTAAVESAPDFSLDLGNGGNFTLSNENRPTYLLFWAEW
ncbi:MAG: hypothetical protein ACRDWA_02490 [Acidimicrobiia bacterium]